MLARSGVDPESIRYAIGGGEEAVGDRYNRGGGALAKAIAESCGLVNANGSDVKAFCTSPVHALVMAGALVESGTFESVVVVAGGSLAKLGMKFEGSLERRRARARGRARRHGGPRRPGRRRRTRGCASTPSASTASAATPRSRRCSRRSSPCRSSKLGRTDRRHRRLLDGAAQPRDHRAGRAATTCPSATTGCSPRSRSCAASWRRDEMDGFCRRRGLPGFSPTQGHIASAVPWIPHALDRFARGELDVDDADGEGQPVPRPHDPDVGCGLRDRGGVNGSRCDRRDVPRAGRRGGNVLIDFWGPRCVPCLALMPAVEKLEEEYGGRFTLVKVNAPENRQIAAT